MNYSFGEDAKRENSWVKVYTHLHFFQFFILPISACRMCIRLLGILSFPILPTRPHTPAPTGRTQCSNHVSASLPPRFCSHSPCLPVGLKRTVTQAPPIWCLYLDLLSVLMQLPSLHALAFTLFWSVRVTLNCPPSGSPEGSGLTCSTINKWEFITGGKHA